ncbi:hypothetical protein [Sphingomonas sp. Root241]|uniref:hypothetical protein n=1 Tax=Sphingomonas sp. Root241 TaxID=1736501 RepID=UPI0006F68586|nr:hypothetical protein [Sphingomonas sp. Root241]KRC82074.1 hypothetical protein ASE13_06995 [Sphingomonas sp. Root241]
MKDHEFAELRAAIDAEIDALPDTPSGIKMGFRLAGQFLVRELLTTEEVDMILWKWEMRAYRGRYVYPDPMMGDYEYIVGKPNA